MQPDFGFVTCSPACSFAFTRAYVRQLVFTTGGWPYTWDGQLFRVFVGDPLIYINNTLFRPEFIEWSSNCYTLDFIVQECYYQVPPGFAHNPAGNGVNWYPNSPTNIPSIQIDFVATGAPFSFIELPPAPPDYWAG